MEFKIDKRYVAIQSLKAMVGYLIGLFIVLVFLNIKEHGDSSLQVSQISFFYTSLLYILQPS